MGTPQKEPFSNKMAPRFQTATIGQPSPSKREKFSTGPSISKLRENDLRDSLGQN